MTDDEKREKIFAACKPLLDQANKEGMWLMWAGDTSIIFSPRELEENWKHGRFVHGPSNWRLVDADDITVDKAEALKRADADLTEWIAHLERERDRSVRKIFPETYDEKVITCFEYLSKKNSEGASPAEVTEEMANRGWLSPLDTVIDIKDIMQRLRFSEGRL
jgi:hypothetical protein